MVKPFLLLSIRAEDAAADNEYEAFLGFSGLGPASCAGSGWTSGRWDGSICGTGRGSCSAAGHSTTVSRTG